MLIAFQVDGEPIPKQSARAGRAGWYTPQRMRDWQELVSWIAKETMGIEPPLRSPLSVRLDFTRSTRHRVDLDNLSKSVLDGMNKIVFNDDQQITHLVVSKTYDTETPGVSVQVRSPETDHEQEIIDVLAGCNVQLFSNEDIIFCAYNGKWSAISIVDPCEDLVGHARTLAKQARKAGCAIYPVYNVGQALRAVGITRSL